MVGGGAGRGQGGGLGDGGGRRVELRRRPARAQDWWGTVGARRDEADWTRSLVRRRCTLWETGGARVGASFGVDGGGELVKQATPSRRRPRLFPAVASKQPDPCSSRHASLQAGTVPNLVPARFSSDWFPFQTSQARGPCMLLLLRVRIYPPARPRTQPTNEPATPTELAPPRCSSPQLQAQHRTQLQPRTRPSCSPAHQDPDAGTSHTPTRLPNPNANSPGSPS